ncbi:Lpx1p [Sugiyamaella lignohabitans]|uniref:Lpx1p n=1 Tax=Sugiyamaella lignohabitans TaxID=796027 RepID=A0A167EVM8_9ASCO|nr:Lpx1p [Sugiyamaella lignohabitans]ANB14516.1 Lpx1p [Sugiyamaella lignohabitans]
MTITKERFVIDAHHPRESFDSTVSPDDRLKLVYNVYKDDRFDNSTADPTTLINLVFAHGTQMNKEIWQYMIELFYNDFGARLGNVVAIDAINHGESLILNNGKLGPYITWSDGGKDINCVIRALNNVGPTILIGQSMGGAMCTYAVIHEPGLIDSIVIIDPVLYLDPEYYTNEHVTALTSDRFKKLEKYIKTKFQNREEYETYMSKKTISRGFHPRVLKDYIDTSAIENPDGTISTINSLDQQLISYLSSQPTLRDLYSLLTAIDSEVLYVCGDIADWNPPDAHEKVIERLRYGSLKIIPGGKHLVVFDMPDETYAAIKDFVDRRGKRGSELIQKARARSNYSLNQRLEFAHEGRKYQLESLAAGKRFVYSKL